MQALERPAEMARFELIAIAAILLAQLTALRSHSYSMSDLAIAAVMLASVLLVSRYRRRLGRLIWSGFMLVFVVIVFAGILAIITRGDISLPPFSDLDLFLSLAGLLCNIVAAYMLWSRPATSWLKGAQA